MSKFMPDKSQMDALKTWYSVDHPLHLDPRHPCIKLAGEAGELLDLYAKNEYKPNFNWFDLEPKIIPIPRVISELGDISYYLRILAYQKQVTFENLCEGFETYCHLYIENDMLNLLSCLMGNSHQILSDYLDDGIIEMGHLKYCAFYFLAILHKLNTPLSQILDLNYKKLNSEETAHGWKSATIKTRS